MDFKELASKYKTPLYIYDFNYIATFRTITKVISTFDNFTTLKYNTHE